MSDFGKCVFLDGTDLKPLYEECLKFWILVLRGFVVVGLSGFEI